MTYLHGQPGLLEAAFEAAGLPYNGEPMHEDVTGCRAGTIYLPAEHSLISLYSHMTESPASPRDTGLRPIKAEQPWLDFRGLLRNDSANFNFDGVDNEGEPTNYAVSVEVFGDESVLTEAQLAFGLKPGETAFKLRASEHAGEEPGGTYLLGVADATVARALAGYIVTHDLRLTDHYPGWLWCSPQNTWNLGWRAAEIAEKYGDEIHEDENNRPHEATQFMKGMDNLQEPLQHINKSLFKVEELAADDQKVRTIRQDLTQFVDNRLVWSGQCDRHSEPFEQTGLITPSSSRAKIRALWAGQIAHMAQQRIDLEDIRPKENDTPQLRAARIDEWADIVKEFKAA